MKSLVIVSVICLLIFFAPPAKAANLEQGEQIFSVNCVGCHPQGGNIIRRGKNLKQAALKKNKADSFDAVYSLVANGKGVMSAFKDRLSEEEIEAVSAYVLDQAAKDWKKNS